MPGRWSRAFSFVSAISLVLLIGVYALWLPSAGAPAANEVTFAAFGDRFTLRSFHGWLSLYHPPAATAGSDAVAAAIARLTNDDLDWTVTGRPTRRVLFHSQAELNADPGFTPTGCTVRCVTSGESPTLPATTDAALARPLLDALEDEHRFAVVHVLLHQRFSKATTRPTTSAEGNTVHLTWDGLSATLPNLATPPKPTYPATLSTSRPKPLLVKPVTLAAGRATIDPSQLPRIRRQWHDLLDVSIFAVPHAALMGVFLLCPIIWAIRLRRRSRWPAVVPSPGIPGIPGEG